MVQSVLEVEQRAEHPETGIVRPERLAASLTGLVADSYLLLIKSQAYHWNVVGPMFVSLHQLTEQHYEDIFAAIDEMAERIRALGFPAPSSVAEILSATEIVDSPTPANAGEMVRNLIRDHETVTRRMREATKRAEDLQDDVTSTC